MSYLFDFDGTLVDSMPTYVSAMLRILDDNNIPYNKSIIKIITPLGLNGTADYYINDLGLQLSKEELILLMKEYMLDATVAKSAPKREDCKEFILSTLRETPGQCMKSDDLTKKAEEYGYSFSTITRVRKELKTESAIETYATGSARKGDRVWYIRLKPVEQEAYEELPMELPTPYGCDYL